MKRSVILALALLFPGCATTAGYVNCDNAEVVKAAAQATIDAIEYACPVPEGFTAGPQVTEPVGSY